VPNGALRDAGHEGEITSGLPSSDRIWGAAKPRGAGCRRGTRRPRSSLDYAWFRSSPRPFLSFRLKPRHPSARFSKKARRPRNLGDGSSV